MFNLGGSSEAGADPMLFVPHPDDILVAEGTGWKMTGPYDQEELDRILESCRQRDLLIIQAVLEEKLATTGEWRSAGGSAEHQPGASGWVTALWINMELPKRFSLNDCQLYQLQISYMRLSKRKLLKAAHQAWRRSGRPKPRGWKAPPLPVLRSRLDAVAPFFRGALEDSRAGKRIDEYALAKQISHALAQS